MLSTYSQDRTGQWAHRTVTLLRTTLHYEYLGPAQERMALEHVLTHFGFDESLGLGADKER